MTPQDLSNAMVRGLQNISPAIVRVDARRRYPLSGTVWEGGFIVTTSRAVEDDEIEVTLEGGSTHQATLVGRDPTTDLALLEVDTDLPAPVWLDEPQLGQLVLSVGRPGELRASLGIVGGLGGPWRTALGGRVARKVQTDAAAFRGFSGGPLVTPAGEVLGINTAALTREAPTTLPTETVRRVAKTLQAHGRMRRGYLGLGGQPVHLSAQLLEASGQNTGLLITSIEPGTPAADAGFLVGDTLLRFGDARVQHPGQLAALLDEEAIGQKVTVTLARAGTLSELNVTVAERP